MISKLRPHLLKNTIQRLGAENDAWLRVIQQRYEARGEEEWRQRHRGGAKLRAGPVGRKQFERVRKDGRDAISAADAKRGKRVGRAANRRFFRG